MSDPYASEEESNAVIRKDVRTPAMQKLDQLISDRWGLEQGMEEVLYEIALDLLEGRIK